jgi:hypothetical protein
MEQRMFDFSGLSPLLDHEQHTYQEFERVAASLREAMRLELADLMRDEAAVVQVIKALRAALDVIQRAGAFDLLMQWRIYGDDGADTLRDCWAVDLLTSQTTEAGWGMLSGANTPTGAESWRHARRRLAAFLAGMLDRVRPPCYEPPPGSTDGQGAGQATTAALTQEEREALAIGCLFQHPDWSIPEIARCVGVNRQTLHGWPKFVKAAEASGRLKHRRRKGEGGTRRRGHKTTDGRIEAYSDPSEDE